MLVVKGTGRCMVVTGIQGQCTGCGGNRDWKGSVEGCGRGVVFRPNVQGRDRGVVVGVFRAKVQGCGGGRGVNGQFARV